MTDYIQKILETAIQLTNELSKIHSKDNVYEFFNENNIKIDINNSTTTLTSFENRVKTISPTYISPEQTGRINRNVDYRSDFYSLGIYLYKSLLNHAPFESEDSLEIIHSHIAKEPESPSAINENIPEVISEIILKLLKKNPEERYQNIEGIKYDFSNCAMQLLSAGKISHFEIGKKDFQKNFRVSDKFYGRESEISELIQIYNKVVNGNVEAAIISGEAGIGKSFLLDHFLEKIIDSNHFVGKGKYEKTKSNLPYTGIIQAFAQIIQQILTESDSEINKWKESFKSALGDNAKILLDMIPELSELIGEYPEVPKLPPKETEERFISVFINFMKVFSDNNTPVIICIDDFQWSDPTSWKLRERLLSSKEVKQQMLIGTYRTETKEDEKRLKSFIQNLKKKEINTNTFPLMGLNKKDIELLISETLHTDDEHVAELGKFFFEKTNLNPFFIKQFFKNLHDEEILKYDQENGWSWDESEINKVNITDNVADLLTRHVDMLPEESTEILKIASCEGFQFNIKTIVSLLEIDKENVIASLDFALKMGMITKLGYDKFSFLHDKIHETIYSMIEEDKKQLYHLSIARLLYQQPSSVNSKYRLFEITGHYNAAINLIKTVEEKQNVAEFNIKVAKHIKNSTAYKQALFYLKNSEFLLGGKAIYDMNFSLAFSLYIEMGECSFLSGNIIEAENIFSEIIIKSKNNIEKATIYRLMIILYTSKSLVDKAINSGINGLKLFNIFMPHKGYTFFFIIEYLLSRFKLLKLDIDKIHELKPMENKEATAIMDILNELVVSISMAGNPFFIFWITTKMINLSLKYGIYSSTYSFVSYGAILIVMLNKFNEGYQFGEIGLKLATKYKNYNSDYKINHLFADILVPWNNHISLSYDYYLKSLENAKKNGDTAFIGYSLGRYLLNLFFSGENLDSIIKYYELNKKTIEKYFEDSLHSLIKLYISTIQTLTHFDSYNILELNELTNNLKENTNIYYAYSLLIKVKHDYILSENENLLSSIRKLKKRSRALMGIAQYAEYFYYYSLVLSRVYKSSTYIRKFPYRIILRSNLKKLKKWSKHCPENFLHKYLLVKAEYEGLNNNYAEALKLYEQAAKSAKENGFTQNEAIAYECAARFYLRIDLTDSARIYLFKAKDSYSRWGANAKVKLIEKEFAHLLKTDLLPANISDNPINNLDIDALTKNSTIISKEVDYDKLKEMTLRIVMEISGAQKAVLIFNEEKKLFVEAVRDIKKKTEFYSGKSVPLNDFTYIPHKLIQNVRKKQEPIILNNASEEILFKKDPYIIYHKIKSILCIPISRHGELKTILYLENNLLEGAFSSKELNILKHLSLQILIALENAILYSDLKKEINEHKKSLEEKNKLEKQVYEQQKLEALGVFASGIAHDFNNILASVLGYTEIALDENQDHNLDFALNEVLKASYRAKESVLQILDFSRQDRKSSVDSTNIVDLLNEVLISMQLDFPKNIKIEKEFLQAEECNVSAESTKLYQVFMNLFINAVHAMEKNGGTLTISIDTKTSEEIVDIYVKDTGHGMSDETANHIFEPYFTTKAAGKGTGLGLAVCYGNVVKFGGNISVSSKIGEGTTFKISFLSSNAETSEKTISIQNDSEMGSEHILVVDDEISLAKLIKKKLSKLGYSVTSFTKASEALEEFTKDPEKFDLIITDLKMPELTGDELAEKIGEISPGKPIIIITGYIEETTKKERIKNGIKGIVSKPISFSELNTLIRTVFKEK